MSPRSKLLALLLASPAFAGVIGCVTPSVDDAHVSTTGDDALVSVNGLSSINGLNSFNGLNSVNGFNSFNGLNSVNGLANGVGLMSSSGGRTTLSYVVKCALPAGRSITRRTRTTPRTPSRASSAWRPPGSTGPATDCQELVSACVLAHVNTSGQHIALWLDGDAPSLGWGRSTDYPYQEGSFFGNIFASSPKAYFCNGKDFDQGTVPGRLGTNQCSSPYTNPFGDGKYCRDYCTAADFPYGNDGYKACNGYNHVVTVWRNFDANIPYKVCSRHDGLCLDVNLAQHRETARSSSSRVPRAATTRSG